MKNYDIEANETMKVKMRMKNLKITKYENEKKIMKRISNILMWMQ